MLFHTPQNPSVVESMISTSHNQPGRSSDHVLDEVTVSRSTNDSVGVLGLVVSNLHRAMSMVTSLSCSTFKLSSTQAYLKDFLSI